MTEAQLTRARRAFGKRLKEARMGDALAQYDVGVMYANGVGVVRSLEKALTWMKAAAEKNHTAAQYLLASAYARGDGTEKNEQQALAWFLRAAEAGYDKAALKLGRFFDTPHPELASQWLLKAAELGQVEAQLAMARHFVQEDHEPASLQAALAWYRKAAAQGHPAAQFALGQLYAEGIGIDIDVALACQWFRAAASQGHAGAQLALDRLMADAADSPAALPSGLNGYLNAHLDAVPADAPWARYAERADASEQYHLACLYESGRGVPQDLDQALTWYEKAAAQGHVEAQVALARLLEPEQPEAAAGWSERAAEQGNAEAQFALGRYCLSGYGRAKDLLQAVTWFARAAVQHYAPALAALQTMLSSDTNSLVQAVQTRLAAHGDAQSEFLLGQRYDLGQTVAQDASIAVDWYARASDQGHAQAQYALASMLLSGRGIDRDLPQALHLFSLAAAQGHPQAQWQMGQLLSTGAEGIGRDARQASAWLKRAAKAGYAPAQATLGIIFAQGGKYDRALQWWRKAADQQDPEALFNLANAYRAGLGVSPQPEEAFSLLLRAAEQGLVPAQARLGLLYATGEGVAQDSIEACKWFVIGADGSDEVAAANRDRARTLLSPAQLKEAERRAADWQRTRESKS